MVLNPFVPHTLIGRELELQQVTQILIEDGDLLMTGVPGSGRHTLICWAARQAGARVVELDCLRATDCKRFLQLLAEGLMSGFTAPDELSLIQRWTVEHPLILEPSSGGRMKFTWHLTAGQEWSLFQSLLTLPQAMAEWLDCRVVLVFQNLAHIRSWDRSGQWEAYLRQEIQCQSRVSYALIATVAEPWVQDCQLQVVSLAPLTDAEISPWLVTAMAEAGLKFESTGQALDLFLSYVQGHFGDAIALARRIGLEYRPRQSRNRADAYELIQPHQVHRSALALIEDLSLTFESLILLLPPTQVRVLESLALDPTDSPHSRDYIRKHQLSRGGGLQGALASLEQKGLVYGPKYGYRIALPLLAFWLKHRLA